MTPAKSGLSQDFQFGTSPTKFNVFPSNHPFFSPTSRSCCRSATLTFTLTHHQLNMANPLVLAAAAAAIIGLVTFGIPLFLAEYFPWQRLWKQRYGRPTVRTKSYQGRTVLITGANGAFGSRAAKLFAHRDVGTLVLVDVRDCGGVKAEIEAELAAEKKPAPRILIWQIDMMTFAGCRELGKKARELKSLDHALLAAGILSFNRRESPEGWEHCASPLTHFSPP